MKMIQINLSSFSPEIQEELRKKVLSLAWDDYIIIGHPEILSIAWDRKESIEDVFPELAPYPTYQ